MIRPVARLTNAAVIAAALWAAATTISVAGFVLGRWLNTREDAT